MLVRRDNREKTIVSLDELETVIPQLLEKLHDSLYQKALENREKRTFVAHNLEEMVQVAGGENGFIKTMWCGDPACEEAFKEKAGVTSRCMPFEQEHLDDVCACCGKPQKPWSTGAKRINKIIFKKLSASKGKTAFFAAKPPAKPGLFADSLLQ